MKNLKVSYETWSTLELQSVNNEEEIIQLSTIDMERNRLFFSSSANFIYSTQMDGKNELCTDSVQLIDLEPGDIISCLQYLMEKEALIVGTLHGLLLLYTVDDGVVETVGQVEGGIRCISPSPDGDLLGLVTGFGQILMMNLDWDILYEMSLDDLPDDVADLHEPSFPAEIPISWRGDGKFFASLSVVHGSSSKKLKVWERDSGAVHSVSEPKPFMGSVLDWTQTGAKIAVVFDRKEEKKCPSVVLFEKNGLERSSFSINEGINVTVESLKFNCTSDLLAAVIRGETFDMLKVWYFSNNHWYLKQEVRYSKRESVKFMWDPTKPLRLITWTLHGGVVTYNFVWVSAVTENSIAFVVDGSKILVTPLSLSLMPPPMYFFKLEFPSAVRDVAFCSKISGNQLAVSLSDESLSIVELPLLDQWDDLEGREFKTESSFRATENGPLLHLAWLDSHVLLGVTYANKTSSEKDLNPGYYLQEIEIRCSEDRIPSSVTCSGWQAELCNQVNLEGIVIGAVPNPWNKHSVLIQFDGGKIFEYMSKLSLNRGVGLQRCDNLGFVSSCPLMDVALVENYAADKNLLLFGLDTNGRLHLEGKLLCNNCSSFSFYSNSGDKVVTHLVITTKQDLLFIVDVAEILLGQLELKYENFLPVMMKYKKAESENSFTNIWEKGAQIVGVLHGDESAVILQTTRGNLECVYPRKLVLTSIVNALTQKRFKDGLLMVRRHRIDFNIIVDHCGWQSFVDSAADFVGQVNNLSYITEFVCAIKNDDIMETLYSNYISLPSVKGGNVLRNKEVKGTNKVNSVLLAIRKALEEHVEETPSRELCILTTLARSDPPALEEALKRIKVIREMELSRTADQRKTSYPSSEESLKHLLWLCDSEAVFEAALGLYDLNLAAIVALNSQKDPKEFLPLLQELERFPPLLMQYKIDLKLQRYESALRHIVSAGDSYYEDSINLMKKVPELYPLGLQLITDPLNRRQVLEGWGDHLTSIKSFEDAATTYMSCSCLDKALNAYRACANWKGALTVAGLIKFGQDDILQLARELIEELQSLGKPADAAKISIEYCGDVETAVNLLVTARNWEEALRIAFLNGRDDLVLVVKNASLECASTLVGEYSEGMEKVGKYLTRYLAVRQRRLLLAATIQSDEQCLDDETASQASSNFSGMSAYTTGTRRGSSASTTMSSRGRGRQRNRGKIRAGSANEEMGLVEHLKAMSLIEGAKIELKSLLISLVMLGEDDTARKLQRSAEKYQLSQLAAVKLADDAMATTCIDENALSLEHYVQSVCRELKDSDAFSWQLKVLV